MSWRPKPVAIWLPSRVVDDLLIDLCAAHGYLHGVPPGVEPPPELVSAQARLLRTPIQVYVTSDGVLRVGTPSATDIG